MKTSATLLALLATLATAPAADLQDLASISKDHGEVQIRANSSGELTLPLARLDHPSIGTPVYALAGEIRGQAVKGSGYLEMWSVFPGQGRFFSRTLAAGGPLGKITGSFAWRPFVLPFDSGKAGAPSSLEINLVLPEGGEVAFRNIRLLEYPGASSPAAALSDPGTEVRPIEFLSSIPSAPPGWWSPRSAGWIGAILGSSFGIMGGLAGLFARRKPSISISLGLIGAAGGALSLLAGLLALLQRQPYAVFYPLLLVGFLGALVFGLHTSRLLRSARQHELKRIAAMDLGN